MTHSGARFVKSVGRMIALVGLLLCASLAFAQTADLTLVKTLRPPGSENNSSLTNVALAGDTAITAYWSRDLNRRQVWYRNPDDTSIGGWSEPRILAEIDAGSASHLALSANDTVVAIGLPDAANGAGEIRMYRTMDGGETWQFEGVIQAPNGLMGFGSKIMVYGNLLVETSSITPAVHSFRFDTKALSWIPAGWVMDIIPPNARFSVATDGERIAFCMTRCTSRVRDDNNEWIVEAQTEEMDPGDEVRDVQVSGEWLVGGQTIYHKEGSAWQPVQNFYRLTSFVLDHDSLLRWDELTWDLQIWRSNGNLWELFATLDPEIVAFHFAFSGDRILADTQSFVETSQAWDASGSVYGMVLPRSYRFGEALAIDDGELRVGIPGSNRMDREAGESLAYNLGGASVSPLRSPIVLPGHVPQRAFARGLLVGEDFVVASSDEGHDGTGAVSIFDRNSDQLLQRLVMPEKGARPEGIDLQGDTLAIGMSSYPGTILIYRNAAGSGFELVQSLVAEEDDSNTGFSWNVILRGDWLVTGDAVFHRDGPDAEFVRTGPLERPDGIHLDTWIMAAGDETLVVMPEEPQSLAIVYHFDNATGWELSGEVPREPPFVGSEGACRTFAVLKSAMACAFRQDGDGFELLVMRPQNGNSDWRISDAEHIDIPGPNNSSPYKMIGSGAYMALGFPEAYVGGTDDTSYSYGGRVLVYLIGEAIFDNGFE